jgi:ubiquitin-conjugating enzyme E2 D/E
MTNIKRLTKEFKDIQKDNTPNLSAGPYNENNLFEWGAMIIGPVGTPYEGGIFKLNISIPSGYPLMAPMITFQTKIYHPNINNVGNICLDILKTKWSPALSISKVLLSICSMMNDPNADDPLNTDAGNLLKTNLSEYNRIAKEWTINYAS